MSEIKDRLVRCFAVVFADVPQDELSTLAARTHGIWDSLATISLIGVVEEEFDTEIPPESIPRLLSFQELLEYLSDHEQHA